MKNEASRLSGLNILDWKGFLVPSVLATFIIILFTWPLLGRSPWIDEVALFTNFPQNSVHGFISPLPYFNQAATPLYSAFWSFFGFLNPFFIRLLSLSLLLFAAIYLVSYSLGNRSILSAIIAAGSILVFKPSFLMLSEMKHYGLEIIACLCIATWVIKKDPADSLSGKDMFFLVAALFLGVSTLPLGIIALGLFVADRLLINGRIARNEFTFSGVYIIISVAYYFFVKRIAFFQVSNYPDTYRYEGIAISVKQYLAALAGLLPGGGLNAIVLFVFIPVFITILRSFSDKSARRLFLFATATFLIYLVLSAIGFYPAKYTRHVIWFSGILWVLLAASISFLTDCVREYSPNKLLSYTPLFALLLISFTPILRSVSFASSDLSVTHNNLAISELKKMLPSSLRFWMEGELVFHYYLRHDSVLSKFSVRDWSSSPSELIKYDNPETYDRTKIDMLPAARDSIRDIKPGQPFLIFASHFDRQGRWAPNRAKGLHEALAERMCKFSTKDFSGVSIYDAMCEK